MRTTQLKWILFVLPVLAAVGCDLDAIGSPDLVAREVDCGATASDLSVDIVDYAFDPAEVSIAPGGVVRWTNIGAVPHTVTSGSPTSDDAGVLFDSRDLEPGDSYCLEFDGTGRAIYYCARHPTLMRDAGIEVARRR